MGERKVKKPDERIVLMEQLIKLQKMLDRKARRLGTHCPWGDRGTPCTQVIGGADGNWLFIFEAGYRASMYPRVAYKLERYHMGEGHVVAVRDALRQERASKDRLVALHDQRPVVEVEWVGGGPAMYVGEIGAKEYQPCARAAGRRARAAHEYARGNDAEAARLMIEAAALDAEGRRARVPHAR